MRIDTHLLLLDTLIIPVHIARCILTNKYPTCDSEKRSKLRPDMIARGGEQNRGHGCYEEKSERPLRHSQGREVGVRKGREVHSMRLISVGQ